jgi:DivIVA domain-containing protein
MPLSADEIRMRRFAVGLRGYEREEVDYFLDQVAADYQLALDAIASASDPYGTLGQEVTDVLRYAQESARNLARTANEEAERLVREASEEAARIREDASEEAATTLETAQEEAARLEAESQRRSRETDEENQNQRRRASEEIEELRRKAEEDAAATLESAGEKAVALIHEAERHARELHETAESKYHQRIGEATERQSLLRAQEDELNDRVVEVARTLQRLLAQLRPGDSPLSSGLANVDMRSQSERVVDLRDAGSNDHDQTA